MEDQSHDYTNKLINSKSPYLLQHAHNPVDWYPWGEEALEKAQKEDKLLIISIGYAACHWCHVMEEESFEDTAVANIMNKHFVNIKVDREERPDIDDIYMSACQLTNSRGCGWPLNAIALPDGRPVYATTYHPKESWIQILEHMIKLKQTNEPQLHEAAEALVNEINTQGKLGVPEDEAEWKWETIDRHSYALLKYTDDRYGGLEGAPKFPMPNHLSYLLAYSEIKGNEEAKEYVLNTLDRLARSGTYDVVGGGFARYATDREWKIPHFEKMLYDNSQLLRVYAEAFKVTSDEKYKLIIDQIYEWLQSEMLSDAGGYFSSLDADSEGEEGKFYVWSEEEIDRVLNEEEAELIKEHFNIKSRGNWEKEKNILHADKPLEELLQKRGFNWETYHSAIDKLYKARSKRVRPDLDDKIITAWNGLLMSGLSMAYEATGDKKYREAAENIAEFIEEKVTDDNFRLYRSYKDDTASINAFLDDYAAVANGLIDLYYITFNEEYLQRSKNYITYIEDHFRDESAAHYYYTSDEDPKLIARRKEITDNVIPASNSQLALAMYQAGHLYYNQEWIETSKMMLHSIQPAIDSAGLPLYFTNWLTLQMLITEEPYEVAIVGDNFDELRNDMQKHFLPGVFYLGGKDEGDLPLLKDKLQKGTTTIYVCKNRICKLPVEKVDKALQLIE